METRRDVFHAISDPTRREIINMIAFKSLNLNAIAEHFDVSRQAISVHIKVLTECGLVAIKRQGRERHCEAKLQKLKEVSGWIEQYRKFWDEQFSSLEKYLYKVQPNKKRKK
ncbi:MAG: transcriptional regulator [Marivirga sp.]|nr:transcriptional regulator [Marivirga sp.]